MINNSNPHVLPIALLKPLLITGKVFESSFLYTTWETCSTAVIPKLVLRQWFQSFCNNGSPYNILATLNIPSWNYRDHNFWNCLSCLCGQSNLKSRSNTVPWSMIWEPSLVTQIDYNLSPWRRKTSVSRANSSRGSFTLMVFIEFYKSL